MDKSKFVLSRKAFSIVCSTVTVLGKVFPFLWALATFLSPTNEEIVVGCVWLLLTNAIVMVLYLPFDMYYVFVLQDSYMLNTQNLKYFIKFKLVEFVIYQCFVIPLTALVVCIVQHGGELPLLIIAECLGGFILLNLYPSYLPPPFEHRYPLREEDLLPKLETLVEEQNFPLDRIYVTNDSIRSTHNKAYICGFSSKKHIVIVEDLLRSSHDEILAVVSHELGHWKHGHIITHNFVMQTNLFLILLLFACKFNCLSAYTVVGFDEDSKPLLVGLYVIIEHVMRPFQNVASFTQTLLMRRSEFQADQFVVGIGQHQGLRKAITRKLVQLAMHELTFPIFDDLYSAWHHCYPTPLERIRALGILPQES